MKPMVKTALTLSLLLPLAGCCDFCWSKKATEVTSEDATHGTVTKTVSKCSHKGCTHDHSKDSHHKHDHNDDIEVQSMEEEMDMSSDEDSMDDSAE